MEDTRSDRRAKRDAYMEPRPAVGAVVFNERGEILMLMRGPHAVTGASELAIPGGKIDPGESANGAAARELLEETGLVAMRIELLSIFTDDRHWGPDHHFVTQYRLVTEWEGEARVMEPNKHESLSWMPVADVIAMARDESSALFGPTRAFVLQGGLHQALATARIKVESFQHLALLLFATAAILILTASTWWIANDRHGAVSTLWLLATGFFFWQAWKSRPKGDPNTIARHAAKKMAR